MSASIYRSSEKALLLLLLSLFLELPGEKDREGSVPRAQHSLILYHLCCVLHIICKRPKHTEWFGNISSFMYWPLGLLNGVFYKVLMLLLSNVG